MKFSLRLFFAVLLVAVVSCGTSIKKRDENGVPKWINELPESNRCIYGVGSAKLSNMQNSKSASLLNAKSNLALQLSSRVGHFSSSYANDTEGVTADAFQSLSVDAADTMVNKARIIDIWTDVDGVVGKKGTVYTLVSVDV